MGIQGVAPDVRGIDVASLCVQRTDPNPALVFRRWCLPGCLPRGRLSQSLTPGARPAHRGRPCLPGRVVLFLVRSAVVAARFGRRGALV